MRWEDIALKISHLIIQNYRNLKSIDVSLGEIVTLIGENNSGKSNFLRAVTLPFLPDESMVARKNLSWVDINDEAKSEYYQYVIENQDSILDGSVQSEEFAKHLPVVMIEAHLTPDNMEKYFVKDLSFSINESQILYGLRYEFKPTKIDEIYSCVKKVLSGSKIDALTVDSVKMNLLPIEYYAHSITVPGKGPVQYDTLSPFRYLALAAERDDFSRTNERIGSKSLIKTLQAGLTDEDKLKIEKEYNHFFSELKSITHMDNMLNWQEKDEFKDAKAFFSHISIFPNMPPMQSILSSVRLGYADTEMSLQGLGNRNLVLLMVLISSLLAKEEDLALSVLTVEEPEAHLCINNIQLLISFIKAFIVSNTTTQLFYSTHSTDFVNKLDLKNVVVLHEGKAWSFANEMDEDELNYISRNPNTDLFKLFFSKKCMLFEGISEEFLLRAYIDSKSELSDIELISFHKGFKSIIQIWKKVNAGTKNKLGIIRDYDKQDKAKTEHDDLDDGNQVCIRTTSERTLEPEFIKTGDNYTVLKKQYGELFGWKDFTMDQMAEEWEKAKASHMLQIAKDLAAGLLPELQMPSYMQEVLDFLK